MWAHWNHSVPPCTFYNSGVHFSIWYRTNIIYGALISWKHMLSISACKPPRLQKDPFNITLLSPVSRVSRTRVCEKSTTLSGFCCLPKPFETCCWHQIHNISRVCSVFSWVCVQNGLQMITCYCIYNLHGFLKSGLHTSRYSKLSLHLCIITMPALCNPASPQLAEPFNAAVLKCSSVQFCIQFWCTDGSGRCWGVWGRAVPCTSLINQFVALLVPDHCLYNMDRCWHHITATILVCQLCI